MIEPFAEDFKAYSILCPLDVAKGFSEGVCSIVPLEIDAPCPCLDHSVYCLDCQRSVFSRAGFEKVVGGLAIFTGKVCGQSFVDGFVEHDDVGLAGFGFFDGDGVTNSFIGEVLDFEAEDVTSSDSIVDTKGEKREVSWF